MSDIIEKGEIADQVDKLEESYQNMPYEQYSTMTSFDDLSTSGIVELWDGLRTLTYMAQTIVGNISRDEIMDDATKLAKIQSEWTKYNELATGLMSEYSAENKSKSIATSIKDWATNLVNKAGKTEGGVTYPAGDFAFVPDPKKPSTWKLRLAEGKPGNVTVAQLGRAAAAFSSGGFRGNKVQLPSGAVAAAKRKIRAAYKRLGVKDDEIPESVKSKEGMMIWKEADLYRWFAVYSNSYRDVDNPPEIISEKSHMNFVKEVDEGRLPYPELWHWHVKGTKYGQADFVAYDQDTGFAMAAGYILPGHEAEAEALAAKDNIKVSHGMPPETVVRDEVDDSVIVGHATVEISDLPDFAAANQLTGFMIIPQEDTMALPKEKKEYLQSLGIDVDAVELNLSKAAAKAAELGIERKEKTEETPAETTSTEPQGATPAVETPVAETHDEEVKSLPTAATLSAADVASIVTEAITPFAIQIAELGAVVKELKEKADAPVQGQSMVTSAQLISQMISKNLSAVGNPATAVAKNAALAKEGPAQTDPSAVTSATPDGMLGRVISNIIAPTGG